MRCAKKRAHHEARGGLVHWHVRVHLPLRGEIMTHLTLVLGVVFLFLMHNRTRTRLHFPLIPTEVVSTWLNRCNSVTLELVHAARAKLQQTKMGPLPRPVRWYLCRSTSSRLRSRKFSTGEHAMHTLLISISPRDEHLQGVGKKTLM